MNESDKKLVSQIVSILLTALLALLAVFGYDVKVIQPREVVAHQSTAPAANSAGLVGDGALAGERGVTGFNDLAVDNVTASGQVAAGGSLASGGTLLQGVKELTLTAGLEVSPAYSVYVLSSTAAVSMTLAAPASPGQVLYLYGDDNNTITVNDSNILTTDGNAVTIGQYDIVEFMSAGAKWVHVAKSADS